MDDFPLFDPNRLYDAFAWWLMWNDKKKRVGLWWLLRFHRRPHACKRYTERRKTP